MTIVMGLDQHRAQITAEWIDSATANRRGTRVAPADRAECAKVPISVSAARSCEVAAGGDDGVAVRGRGATPGGCGGASG